MKAIIVEDINSIRMAELEIPVPSGNEVLLTVPEESLIPLPVDLPKKLATFAEPMGCSINALEHFFGLGDRIGFSSADRSHDREPSDLSASTPPKSILISGGGTCGLIMALAAKEIGFSPLILEPDTKKFKKSADFADLANITLVSGLPEGKKYDCAVNATSAIEAVSIGINSLKPGGEYSIFSGLNSELDISASLLNQIHYRQLTLKGAYGCTKKQMEKALTIISNNKKSVELLIEDIVTLEDVTDLMKKVANGETYRYIVQLL